MNKILCVSTTGMGNALLYTPLIKNLAAKHPRAIIDVLVGNPAAAEVVQGLPGVRNVTLLRKSEMSLGEMIKLIRSLRQENYDLFVSSFLDKSLKVALFGSLLKIPQRAGFANAWWKVFYTHTAPLEHRKHEVEYNLKLLSSLGIESGDSSLGLTLTDDDRSFARSFLSRNGITAGKSLIGIHPGSDAGAGKTIKRWPLERFARLADTLAKKHNATIILFGGKEETDLSERMAALMSEKPVIATGQTTVKQAAALIQSCKLFISNDSGLMHVASAVNVPVTAIFGPTLSWKNYPWHVPHRIVKRDLTCSPCYTFHTLTCRNPVCLTSLEVEDVFKAAEELLDGRQ